MFLFNMPKGDIIYDIETYPNVFTLTAEDAETGREWVFEISDRRNDASLFRHWMDALRSNGSRMVGFNNIGFDYPVIHYIYQYNCVTVEDIYTKAMSIINAPFNARFSHMIYESDWIVEQIDLYKIHHFDNRARATSLKVLEFNMRMDNIEDLPFELGLNLTSEQIDMLITYNKHDVKATKLFYNESIEQIRFREQLTKKYDKNFMNHNDTKIGKDYFIMELEKHTPGCCYRKVDGRKKIMQTPRDSINLADVILSMVQFHEPEFNRILDWFKSQTITETKGSIKDINCTIDGFKFDFGTGGIHGSVEPTIIQADDDHMILDIDVTSYYPTIAIANRLYPAHLGEKFCDIYEELFNERKGHAKGTAENAMLKLALNGVYGDSNNEYSPFYDPQYTMAITINGQIMLCMLAEALMADKMVDMIQVNTDGLTIRCPRHLYGWVGAVCKWWEQLTGLALEEAEYSRMFIRDVNNYIAEYTNGTLKRKGAYEYELGWHQNHSNLVVPMAAEAKLVHGTDIRTFIENHENVMDFMLRAKIPRDSSLEWGGEKVANIVRYYISTEGDILEKVMPPKGPVGHYKRANSIPEAVYAEVVMEIPTGTWDERIHTKNKSTYEIRRTGINTGWNVRICNDIKGCTYADLNHEWYIQEAEKLISCML